MADILTADPNKVNRASLVQLLEGLALSGRMVVEVGGEEVGWADFVEGRPVSASVGAVRGLDALYDLFVIDVSAIRFVGFPEGRHPAASTPLGDGLTVVMNGCRLRDEFVRVSPVVAAPATVGVERASAPVRSVLAQLDGECTLAQAIHNAGVSPSAVLDELRDLLESRTLTRLGTAAPPAPPVNFDDAVASGRRHFRDGDLERAEADFLWAVAQRPEDRVVRQNLARVRQARARHWVGKVPRARGRG